MNTLMVASAAAVMSLVAAKPAVGQVRVVGDVIVSAGPVRAHVIVGNPYPRDVYVHRYPPRRIVYAPRVIVIERSHYRGHGQRFGPYRHQGYREVRAWYDSRRHAYYDGYGPGLREAVIYEGGGRFYEHCDD